MNRRMLSDEDLQKGWRSLPAVDPQALVRATRRELLRMRAIVALECAILAAACLLFGWAWRQSWATAWLVYIGFFAVGGSALAVSAWTRRRGSWRAASDSTRDLLHLAVRRARAGIALARLNLVGLLVVATFLLLWSFASWESVGSPRLLLVLVLALAACVAWAAWCLRHIRARREALQRLAQDGADLAGGR